MSDGHAQETDRLPAGPDSGVNAAHCSLAAVEIAGLRG